MLTFDDFLVGREQFGIRMQPVPIYTGGPIVAGMFTAHPDGRLSFVASLFEASADYLQTVTTCWTYTGSA